MGFEAPINTAAVLEEYQHLSRDLVDVARATIQGSNGATEYHISKSTHQANFTTTKI